MPSFQDSAFIFILALILFGPKRLPELARQLGKLMGEFRRASNEFRSQMEEELRVADQAEKTKKIAAIESAAPVLSAAVSGPAVPSGGFDVAGVSSDDVVEEHPHMPPARRTYGEPGAELQTVPIATSGDLQLMPPATGLPLARSGDSVVGVGSVASSGSASSSSGPSSSSSGNGDASVASVFESFPQAAESGVRENGVREDLDLTVHGNGVRSISGGASDSLLADKAAHHA